MILYKLGSIHTWLVSASFSESFYFRFNLFTTHDEFTAGHESAALRLLTSDSVVPQQRQLQQRIEREKKSQSCTS